MKKSTQWEIKLVEQNEDAEAVKDDVEEDQGMLGDVGVDRNVDEMAVEENRDAEENGIGCSCKDR